MYAPERIYDTSRVKEDAQPLYHSPRSIKRPRVYFLSTTFSSRITALCRSINLRPTVVGFSLSVERFRFPAIEEATARPNWYAAKAHILKRENYYGFVHQTVEYITGLKSLDDLPLINRNGTNIRRAAHNFADE